MDATVVRARELLAGLQQSLRGDGYDLVIDAANSGLKIIVSAGPDVCAECLVPPDIFESIVSSTLKRGDLDVSDIEIVYPTVLPH